MDAMHVPGQSETELTLLVRAALSEHTPIGAYRIAQVLKEQTGKPGYANTVYRIIAPMVRAGEVIALAAVKGWVLADARWTSRLILLCTRCQTAQQVPAAGAADAVNTLCLNHDFVPKRTCFEVIGLCRNCSGQLDQEANY